MARLMDGVIIVRPFRLSTAGPWGRAVRTNEHDLWSLVCHVAADEDFIRQRRVEMDANERFRDWANKRPVTDRPTTSVRQAYWTTVIRSTGSSDRHGSQLQHQDTSSKNNWQPNKSHSVKKYITMWVEVYAKLRLRK